ncbi:DUF6998 domain-containing protein [Allohahella marinimesophila]|uniref:DUF6998 domain-containing protein n=1 Tax=Allohahella marinimesophila TaxID=1054972 RepID=A0ABP7Q7J9_9GAMM
MPSTDLRHLCGRIGELYTALITIGQMATEVNRYGYEVVSSEGDRISVKTTETMGAGGYVSFNPNTLNLADRIVILRINTDEMQIEMLLYASVAEAEPLFTPVDGKGRCSLPFSKLVWEGPA